MTSAIPRAARAAPMTRACDEDAIATGRVAAILRTCAGASPITGDGRDAYSPTTPSTVCGSMSGALRGSGGGGAGAAGGPPRAPPHPPVAEPPREGGRGGRAEMEPVGPRRAPLAGVPAHAGELVVVRPRTSVR